LKILKDVANRRIEYNGQKKKNSSTNNDLQDKLDHTKGLIRCRKSTKDSRCNDQYKYEYNQQTN